MEITENHFATGQNEAGAVPAEKTRFLLNTQWYARFFLRGSLLLLVLLALIAAADGLKNPQAYATLLWAVFSGVCLLALPVIWAYRLLSRRDMAIQLTQTSLVVPRAVFWQRRIPREALYSLESMGLRGSKYEFYCLGIKGEHAVDLYELNFANRQEYRDLLSALMPVLQRNAQTEKAPRMAVRRVYGLTNAAQTVLMSLWLSVLCFTLWGTPLSFEEVVTAGALAKNVLAGEELFRLASWFFLHSNIMHLLFNGLLFMSMSDVLLRVIDAYRLLLVLLLSTLAAAFTTLIFSPHEYVIGASGGTVGMFGAYLALKVGRVLPGSVSRVSDAILYGAIVLQVVSEFFIDHIDSYAHFGGFVAGIMIMRYFLLRKHNDSILESSALEKAIACALAAGYLVGLVHYVWLAHMLALSSPVNPL